MPFAQRRADKWCSFRKAGALGAYQVGVYEALHEAKVEPDWIIGTSIGAINASIIAGNRPSDRLAKLHEFGAGWSAPVPGRSGSWDNKS